MELYDISVWCIVYWTNDIWYNIMIVIYKETLANENIPLDIPIMECVTILDIGRVENEVDRIKNDMDSLNDVDRIEYGQFREVVNGKTGNSVCIVYDKVKWYVVKV